MSAPPHLTNERRNELTRLIEACENPIIESLSCPDRWTETSSTSAVSHFEANLQTDRVVYTMSTQKRVNCSVENAMKAIASDTTERFASLEASFLPISSKDIRVLATLRPRTKEDRYRYVGVKWVHFASSKQDVVFAEATGTGRDKETGRKFAYRVLKSVELPEFQLQGVERIHVNFFAVKFIQTDRPNVIQMQCSLNIHTECKTTMIAKLYQPSRCISKYKSMLESYQRGAQKLVLSMPTGRRVAFNCSRCKKSFRLGKIDHNCVICSSCFKDSRTSKEIEPKRHLLATLKPPKPVSKREQYRNSITIIPRKSSYDGWNPIDLEYTSRNSWSMPFNSK